MRTLGWVFVVAIAVSLIVTVWAWAFSDHADAASIRDSATLLSLCFGIGLGVVEHLERKHRV